MACKKLDSEEELKNIREEFNRERSRMLTKLRVTESKQRAVASIAAVLLIALLSISVHVEYV